MSLPAWMAPLPDADQMRAIDGWAIEELKIPSLDLMERAGTGLARLVEDVAADGPVAVVCGKGNNGGDGYVAARVLRAAGREVRVLHVGDLRDVKGDAKANLDRLGGDPPQPLRAGALDGAAVVVDALLGTGFSGAPRDDATEAIAAINACAAPAVAADIASGVDASTGAIAGEAVVAVATATFAAAKPGHWVYAGKEHSGRVVVVDIGIPDGAPVTPQVGLIEDAVVGLLTGRGAQSTKFSSGHVLVAGGSRGLTGAVCLAAEAAMRAGAGYVTACVPASLEQIFEVKLTEVMSAALPDDDGALNDAAVDALLERSGRGGALVLGPGIGRSEGATAFAREAAGRADVSLVIDADGLNAHGGMLEHLRDRPAPTVLTPHAGELARLLEVESAVVNARRLEHARGAARRAGAVVVLKGDDTIVAEPDGRVGISRGGSPALATAGTGDVLSGVLGAFLARGLQPFEAACAAVHVHAEAGRRAALLFDGPDGVIARDVIDELPHALAL